VSVTYPPGREGAAQRTVPLEDLALSDRESIFHTPRAGDLALLGVLVAVLLGNGAWLWRQMGFGSQAGRAVFFGMVLLCIYWCAVVYIFKLSLAVSISPRSISVVRGPWRVEIRWSELTRLMERMQPLDGRRYRWVIAIARDGRRISVREDAIGDYARFRREAYERYRLWRDHGGTWGATGSGPFLATETIRDEARWWAFAATMIALPGFYFALLLPETNPLGYALLAIALLCLVALTLSFLRRQRYTVDRHGIETRSSLSRTRLTWGEVTKVERTRHPVGGVILAVVALGRFALRLASRGDAGLRTFAWSPRVPEYLILRGGGRHARMRLHRLDQPDELLAWIEFYDQMRHAGGGARSRPRAETATSGPVSHPLSADTLTPDMSGPSGPLDPWGSGRQGEPTSQPVTAPTTARRPTAAPVASFADEARFNQPETDVEDAFTDEPPDDPSLSSGRGFEQGADDAWLRETSAMASLADSPQGADDAPAQPTAPEAVPWRYQRERPQADVAARDAWRQEPAAATMPEPVTPAERPTHDAWRQESAAFVMPEPVTPVARPARDTEPISPGWADAWAEPAAALDADQWSDAERDDGASADDEEASAAEVEVAQPWREANWQPPVLPRFGPPASGQGAQRDDASDRD